MKYEKINGFLGIPFFAKRVVCLQADHNFALAKRVPRLTLTIRHHEPLDPERVVLMKMLLVRFRIFLWVKQPIFFCLAFCGSTKRGIKITKLSIHAIGVGGQCGRTDWILIDVHHIP